jgi:farnesyl-diphosphate farnesyltransferase
MAVPREGIDRQLTGALLRSVSRSFYISVRLLPRHLRSPVGLAYLLARATDTLADTVDVPAAIRRRELKVLARAIQEGETSGAIADLETSFGPLQKDEAERTLMRALPECLRWLGQLESEDAKDIRVVLDRITQAQMLDVDRFADPDKLQALASTAELEEYAYLIAGCVGEFWTELGRRHLPDFAERPHAEMRELGRRYGVGLQLINILRDAHGDLRAGRCYFPGEELKAIGLTPLDILAHPVVFKPVFEKWINRAEEGLNAGMEYVEAICDRRVRAATALPALIGARTISLLRSAGPRALMEKIKVPRKEVRGMVASVAITLARRKTLAEIFRANLAGN